MSEIKIVTTQKHRFGKVLNIKGEKVSVDGSGKASVSPKIIHEVLLVGFELEDKTTKLPKIETEDGSTEKIQQLIAEAEAKAKQIVAEAEAKAKQIVAEAETKAKQIVVVNQVDEKEDKRKQLAGETNDTLKSVLKEAGVEESLWKDAKKDTLVDLIMEIAFKEE